MSARSFLQRIPLARAVELLTADARPTEVEHVDPEASLGRVTAEPVVARLAAPPSRVSAMDGIAVRAADTLEAGQGGGTVLSLSGETTEARAGSDHDAPGCTRIDTGQALPDWADAVVRIEETRETDDGFEIRAPVTPGRDVRRAGEDVEAGAVLFGRGHRVRPYDVGAMLATAVRSVAVRRTPRVAVVATGSEVVEPGTDPKPGQVIEFNSRMLAGLVREWGADAFYRGRVADDRSLLAQALREATRGHDVVCVIAGSSAGRRDFTVPVFEECGRLLAHGVDIAPGKPVALAVIDGTPVIGVPGYPVSAIVVFRELLAPLIARLLGAPVAARPTATATVRRKIASRLGVEEFVRVCLAHDGGTLVVAPLPRGAAAITTVVRAHGILRIPATTEGYDSGSTVTVELLEGAGSPYDDVVVGGRPDPVTALLEDMVRRVAPATRFRHLGLGDHDAVAAMTNGEAHLAAFDGVLESPPGDGGRIIPVSASGGRGHCTLALSRALLASAPGRLVDATVSSPEFRDAASRLA